MPFARFIHVLILSATMLAGGQAFAQSTFLHLYPTGYEGRSVREVGGNAYAVAGGTDLYANWHWHMLSPTANTKVHLFKTDDLGTLLWQKTYAHATARVIGTWMETTADGGYVIAGNGNRDRVWPPDSNDVLLMKTDALGNLSWSRVFDTGADEIAHCVRPTADGGYILSGFHDALPMSAVGNTYALLIKTDALGNVQWSKRYPFAVRDFITGEPFTYVVRPLADGGYAIVGTAIGALALGVYVIRTDADGDVIWAKVFEHDLSVLRYSTGLDVAEAANGDLVIAGSMDKQQPMETNYPYILRVSAAGALLHARFYETNPALFFQSGFSSVVQTPDGGWFFTGMGGYGEFGDQAQLLRTEGNLNVQWSRVYTWDGIATMGARSGRPSSDGGYVFTGKRQMNGSTLLKTDALGLIDCKTPNALLENVPSVQVVDRFPVPVAGINAANMVLITNSPVPTPNVVCAWEMHLPVELIAFDAMALPERKAGLHWTTVTETGNDEFIVERSDDGSHFEAIAHIDGAGNSQHRMDYSYTDEAPLPAELNYYRLRQVDVTGEEASTHVVAVRFGTGEFQLISAVGDRETGTIVVTMNGVEGATVEHRLTDMMGRLVASGSHTPGEGAHTFRIEAVGLSAGTYALIVTDGTVVQMRRLHY